MANTSTKQEGSAQILDRLLDEFSTNRGELHDMIGDVRAFRKSIEKLLPEKIDHRNKFVWEEKMKTITNVIATELSIRRQVDDSIKTELTIRNKTEVELESGRDLYEALGKLIEDGTIKMPDSE